MTIRVIRTMEYTYPNLQAAERDMANWQVPATGVKVFQTDRPIRSSHIITPVAASNENCPTNWRKPFDTRQEAVDFLIGNELDDEVESYACPPCKKWHVRPIKGV